MVLNFNKFLKLEESLSKFDEKFSDELDKTRFSIVNVPVEYKDIIQFEKRASPKKISVSYTTNVISKNWGIESVDFKLNRIDVEFDIKPIDDIDKESTENIIIENILPEMQEITVKLLPFRIEDLIIDMNNSGDPNLFKFRFTIGKD